MIKYYTNILWFTLNMNAYLKLVLDIVKNIKVLSRKLKEKSNTVIIFLHIYFL